MCVPGMLERDVLTPYPHCNTQCREPALDTNRVRKCAPLSIAIDINQNQTTILLSKVSEPSCFPVPDQCRTTPGIRMSVPSSSATPLTRTAGGAHKTLRLAPFKQERRAGRASKKLAWNSLIARALATSGPLVPVAGGRPQSHDATHRAMWQSGISRYREDFSALGLIGREVPKKSGPSATR